MTVYHDDKVGWRIKELRKLLKLSQGEFAEKADLSQPQISGAEKGNRNITSDIILKIRNAYKVNIDWLQRGSGNMFSVEDDESDSGVTVPFYDLDVTGSFIESFSDMKEKADFYVDFRPFNDCTAYFPIYGDSMYPRFASGEIVAVKEVENRNTILWGESYLIITDASENNLRTVKTIHPCEADPDCIILRATNPNFKGDTIIKKSSIIGLFLIKGKIRRDQI